MKKVDFNKLQAGDLVEVPRTQFAPMRSGWNGWLFSEAVVIRKGVGRKSKRNVVVVEMRTPAGKNSEPVTDEQVAAQMQQAEPLVIETPEAAAEGSIRVYDYDGCCIYAYYGKIRINNDGKDGKDIDVEAIGYLEGYQEHKEESGARE